MAKIISCVLEDCIFNISFDKKLNKIFKPNQKIHEFIKNYLNKDYQLIVLSNFCESDYIGIDSTFSQYDLVLHKIYYSCDHSKLEIILNKIKPDIYIDTHIELCAGLDFYNIDTYLFAQESSCIKNNKCATGLKIL